MLILISDPVCLAPGQRKWTTPHSGIYPQSNAPLDPQYYTFQFEWKLAAFWGGGRPAVCNLPFCFQHVFVWKDFCETRMNNSMVTIHILVLCKWVNKQCDPDGKTLFFLSFPFLSCILDGVWLVQYMFCSMITTCNTRWKNYQEQEVFRHNNRDYWHSNNPESLQENSIMSVMEVMVYSKTINRRTGSNMSHSYCSSKACPEWRFKTVIAVSYRDKCTYHIFYFKG